MCLTWAATALLLYFPGGTSSTLILEKYSMKTENCKERLKKSLNGFEV